MCNIVINIRFVILLLLLYVDIIENKTFLIETIDKESEAPAHSQREKGQDYSDDKDEIIMDASSKFNTVTHERKEHRDGDSKANLWNEEGSGIEIVSEDSSTNPSAENSKEDDSYWNREGFGPQIVTEEPSTNSTMEVAYDIPSEFLDMLTKSAE